jgi:hypothetical protein
METPLFSQLYFNVYARFCFLCSLGATDAVEQAVHYMERRNAPYAFLVKRQTFTKYSLKNKKKNTYPMKREVRALRIYCVLIRAFLPCGRRD